MGPRARGRGLSTGFEWTPTVRYLRECEGGSECSGRRRGAKVSEPPFCVRFCPCFFWKPLVVVVVILLLPEDTIDAPRDNEEVANHQGYGNLYIS